MRCSDKVIIMKIQVLDLCVAVIEILKMKFDNYSDPHYFLKERDIVAY